MQQDLISPKPSSSVLNIIIAIGYALFVYGMYQFNEYEASLIEYPQYQSFYVYLFAGSLLLGYSVLLLFIPRLKLRPVLITIGAMLTVFFINSILQYVVSEKMIILYSALVIVITAAQFSRAKDASVATMLICLLNISIFTGLSNDVIIGLHIVLASVVVLYALSKQWKITHHFFMFVLCSCVYLYILGALIEKQFVYLVLYLLFIALYIWTYRKVKAAR